MIQSISILLLALVSTGFSQSALAQTTQETFFKFHQALERECRESKLNCSAAFPQTKPNRERYLVERKVIQTENKAELQIIATKITAEIPAISKAFKAMQEDVVTELGLPADQNREKSKEVLKAKYPILLEAAKKLAEGLAASSTVSPDQVYQLNKLQLELVLVEWIAPEIDVNYELEFQIGLSQYEVGKKIANSRAP